MSDFNSTPARNFLTIMNTSIRRRKIYVASSWRNPFQPFVVQTLKAKGHEVYDFRHPRPGNTGFRWSAIDPNWKSWTAAQWSNALDHPIAKAGYALDFAAMKWADTFVLILPCGRSAHLELGWACGQGKQTLILSEGIEEPELMAKMCDHICGSLYEVLTILED